MSQALARKILMQTLAAYASAHAPVLSISRENTSFTKPVDGATFLEVFIIPADTTTPNISADRRRFRGSVQINIWTKQGIGAGTAEGIAEEISQLFKVFPKTLLPLSIEAPATIKKSNEDISQWWVTPVSLTYRLDAEN